MLAEESTLAVFRPRIAVLLRVLHSGSLALRRFSSSFLGTASTGILLGVVLVLRVGLVVTLSRNSDIVWVKYWPSSSIVNRPPAVAHRPRHRVPDIVRLVLPPPLTHYVRC